MGAAIQFRPLMVLRLKTGALIAFGSTSKGALTLFPVLGGSFEGDRLRGTVLPGGGDWITAGLDGTFSLDLRITLETDDGSLIHMTFGGVRDDARHYLRTTPRFETASTKYAFLNRLLAVGTGEIGRDGPIHIIEEIV